MRSLFITLTALLFVGCATVPKPQELVNLEEMRGSDDFQQAQESQEQLIAESEKAYQKATESWEDEEIDDAKHWAALGTIKLRTALTIVSQVSTRDQVAKAKEDFKKLQEQNATLEKENREADERIQLHEQLADSRSAAEKQAQELNQTQKLAQAQKDVSEAQIALKRAETVEAAKYAQSSYNLAQTMLNKAITALGAKNAVDATVSANVAKTKAEAAYQEAKVKYQSAKENANRQAKNQALQRDAAAIGGVAVRLKAIGQTQHLILPVLNLFKRRATTPRGDKLHILNAVGELLKKYPKYPVIINGYTSYKVRRSQRYVVSQTRAQQVANHFVSMGVPFKRFAVTGYGAENLVGRKYSTMSDRVEIILLFQ